MKTIAHIFVIVAADLMNFNTHKLTITIQKADSSVPSVVILISKISFRELVNDVNTTQINKIIRSLFDNQTGGSLSGLRVGF